MSHTTHFALGLLLMALTTYLVRVLPLLLLRHPVRNRFLRSFFFYIPYAVLAAMSFPDMLFSTGNLISGIVALAVCVILSLLRPSLVGVALGGAVSVLLCEIVIRLF